MAQKGTIVRLISDKGFGFIKAGDGKEYFFHQSGVREDFSRLREGQEVEFDPTQGPKGLRAESIQLT